MSKNNDKNDNRKMQTTMSDRDIREFLDACAALEGPSKISLMNRCRKFLGGTRYDSTEDLYDEALDRVLSGSREWERNLTMTNFLYQVMRSIASVDTRHSEARHFSYEEWAHGAYAPPDSEFALSPEELMIKRQSEEFARATVAESKQRLSHHPKTLAVFQSIALELTPQEARAAFSLTEKEYKASREQIFKDIRGNLQKSQSRH